MKVTHSTYDELFSLARATLIQSYAIQVYFCFVIILFYMVIYV